MYLGQERFGQARGPPGPASNGVAPRPRGVPVPPPVQQNHGASVGDATRIIVTGCTDGEVGPYMRGTYALAGLNHGKPVYKRDGQVDGSDVLIYFWDERDGVANAGWWFAPAIGDNMVWAYHPSRTTASPPSTGWKAPISAPIDQTIVVRGASEQQLRAMQQQEQSSELQQRKAAQMTLQQKYREEALQQAKLRAAENQKLKEEQLKKAKEEQQKRMQEQQKRNEESRAAFGVMKILQKLKAARVDTFDAIKKELEESLEKDLEACGSQKDKVKADCQAGIEQAEKRMEHQLVEKRKLQEAWDRAEELLVELEGLSSQAQSIIAGSVADAAAPLIEKSEDLKCADDVTAANKQMEAVAAEAREKLKACTDFIVSKRSEIAVGLASSPNAPPRVTRDPNETLGKISQGIHENTRTLETTLSRARVNVSGLKKKAEATSRFNAVLAVFDKYDKDGDGLLNRKEILQYSKGEFDFVLPLDRVEHILEALVGDTAKGVAKEDFQILRVQVGLARERVRDAERKKQRVEREAELAELRAKHEKSLAGAMAVVDAARKALEETESRASSVTKLLGQAETGAVEMLSQAAEFDGLARSVREKLKEAEKAVSAAKEEEVDSNLKSWYSIEVRKVDVQLSPLAGRLNLVSSRLTALQTRARRREGVELDGIRAKAVAAIQKRLQTRKLQAAALFAEVASKKGSLSLKDWLALFKSLEADSKAQATAEEQNGEQKAQNGSAPTVALSSDDAERLFTSLDDEEEGVITEAKFVCLLWKYMKVAKDAILTSDKAVDSKSIRRLESSEVVRVVDGPMVEEKSGLERIRALTCKDNAEGWITIKGNQGTVFLEEVKDGHLFRVVQETILTSSFEIGAATRKVVDTTRKLQAGEVVEVREWPKKEEKTGLLRMKCKVKTSGEVGWATVVGNTGGVYLVQEAAAAMAKKK
mmetsp:Transcript_51215/g.89399  ORF Transcript_51215/g.89399 Transcript_51215/m.89399 type:complete len:934 (+) Transcript_51215:125-2926(+)